MGARPREGMAVELAIWDVADERRRRTGTRGGTQDLVVMLVNALAGCWVRDVHEEGIEPHPGPSALSKNVDGLSDRFGDAMHRISQRHKRKPILVFFLQEHHLTQLKAGELRVHTVARTAGLLYVQAHRPVGEVKGGTAIVIPLDMIERKEGESVPAAERRVYNSAYRSPDGRLCSVTTLINGTPVTMSSIYAPVTPADRPGFFTAIKPRMTSPHLIGMDANCVFDTSIDVSRPAPPSPDDTRGSAELRTLLTDADVTDIARETMGDAPFYTHTKVLQGGVNTTRKRLDQIHTPTLDATQCVEISRKHHGHPPLPELWARHDRGRAHHCQGGTRERSALH